MKILALLIALLALPQHAPADDLVARATDLTLSRADLGEWLVRRVGVSHVSDFLAEQLELREARARGLFPTEDEVTAAWESERTRIVETIHQGREDRYLADIAGRGYSIETWEARRREQITTDLCEMHLAQADRVITDEALQGRFRDIYGETGEQTTIEVLFFSAYRDLDPLEKHPDVPRLKQDALERARAAGDAWRAGATLEELAADSDRIQSEFVHDGRVSVYHRSLLGPAVDRAVNSLDRPGEVSPPVEVFDGSYVVRLVGRRDVSFESARAELTRMLTDETPTSGERSAVREALMQRDKGEVLLR